jgi:hypothetical protein
MSMNTLLRLSSQMMLMSWEAQRVATMRIWGMGGYWGVTSGENARMVDEKGTVAVASAMAAGRAMMLGQPPASVALAALKPVRAKTRANAKRLAKLGPSLPKTKV